MLLAQYFEDHDKTFDMTTYLKGTRLDIKGQTVSMGQLLKQILQQKGLYALLMYWYFDTNRNWLNYVLKGRLVSIDYSHDLPWLEKTIIETLIDDGYTREEATTASGEILTGIRKQHQVAYRKSPAGSTRSKRPLDSP
jgi:hypothetical protein